jgi:sulfate adenylyltransferase subunit 2
MEEFDYLDELESRSIYIIREAYCQYRDTLAALWSIGKDSTVMIHLLRKAFLGKVPIPVVHLDTSYKFREIYAFRDEYAKKWGLKLIVMRNCQAIDSGMSPEKGHLQCCTDLKTNTLKQCIGQYGLKALFLAIRRDEHSIRAKERIFSPRGTDFQWNYQNQPPELWDHYNKTMDSAEYHFRIHPMLGWAELDIWRYIRREKLPIVSLYFSKSGKRYRSIGCEVCCSPVNSSADSIEGVIKELETVNTPERAGRAQDKEQAYMMQKLRALGYM